MNAQNDAFDKCKTCGFDICSDDSISIDCIYPLNVQRTSWNCYCNPTMGGCGRVVYAASRAELSKLWNSGVTSEVIV